MARTAPVPNIPAIPGMCPGIAVLGGGGGSGGKGGKGAGSGGGDNGADGEGGADGTDGDGRGACAGSGGTAGCPKHTGKPGAGDPVEVASGRVYTVPAVDLSLPGPMPLKFVRRYTSAAAERTSGLGHGWAHTFCWKIEERRRTVRVFTEEGRMVEFERCEVGEATSSEAGWILYRTKVGYALSTFDDALLHFAPAPEPGSYRLVQLTDRNGNDITLCYDEDGRLTGLVDSTARVVRVVTDLNGDIRQLLVRNAPQRGQWIAMANYSYDDNGDLVKFTDGDGYEWHYRYEEHRLTECRGPDGFTNHYVYDRSGRCYETWGDYPGYSDPSLDESAPAALADGTPAKGVHHVRIHFGPDGYVEVADSLEVKRYHTNERGQAEFTASGSGCTTRTFDDAGHLTSITDALGAVDQYVRDDRGRLMEHIDPAGNKRIFERNSSGALTRFVAPDGGVWHFGRDNTDNVISVSDPTGRTTTYERDGFGRMTREHLPNGGTRKWLYGLHGCVTAFTDENGNTTQFEWDELGRLLVINSPSGGELRTTYSHAGRVTAMYDANGEVTRYSYDGNRRLAGAVLPDGRTYRFGYGGSGELVSRQEPDGVALHFRYDREGRLKTVVNERGERHRIEHDALGQITSETMFDGRVASYGYDMLGRMISEERGDGEKTLYEYDMAGDLAKIIHPDDSETQYRYDPCHRVVEIANGETKLQQQFDLAGRLIRETQEYRGEAFVVDRSHDARGAVSKVTTSEGLRVALERDLAGRVSVLSLPGEVISQVRDPNGRELQRIFQGGAQLTQNFDRLGLLAESKIISQLPEASAGPEWVGDNAPGLRFRRTYAYDFDGELQWESDNVGNRTSYRYDPRNRFLERYKNDQCVEDYRYDPAGNPYDGPTNVGLGSGQRKYGPGNVLERKGDFEYHWDEHGRLAARTVVDQPEDSRGCRYSWTQQGLLEAVEFNDRRRIAFVYDGKSRRLAKRIYEHDGNTHRLVEVVRYCWNTTALVHEIRTRAAAAGDPVRSVRTYWHHDDGMTPLAHRDGSLEPAGDEPEHEVEPWVHYVTDVAGRPRALVNGNGRVLAEPQVTGWGVPEAIADDAAAQTPFLSLGQQYDVETGLAYNGHRYYAPDLGRYVSPDPSGLNGGYNYYKYCTNPISWMDPFGLHGATAMLGTDGDMHPVTNSQHPGQPFESGYAYDYNKDSFLKDKVDANQMSTGEAYGQSHSEKKIMREVLGGKDPATTGPDPNLEGKTLEITGDERSCPSCASALQEFAQKNKMKVVYKTSGKRAHDGKPNEDLVIDCRPGGTGQDNTADYSSDSAAHYRAREQKQLEDMTPSEREAYQRKRDARNEKRRDTYANSPEQQERARARAKKSYEKKKKKK